MAVIQSQSYHTFCNRVVSGPGSRRITVGSNGPHSRCDLLQGLEGRKGRRKLAGRASMFSRQRPNSKISQHSKLLIYKSRISFSVPPSGCRSKFPLNCFVIVFSICRSFQPLLSIIHRFCIVQYSIPSFNSIMSEQSSDVKKPSGQSNRSSFMQERCCKTPF